MKDLLNVFLKELSFPLGILFYTSIMLNGLGLTDIDLYKIAIIWFFYSANNFAVTLISKEKGSI